MEEISSSNQKFIADPAEVIACDNAQGYYLRATHRLSQQRQEEAIADLKKAKALDANYAFSYWLLGLIYRTIDQTIAMKELNQAVSLFRAQGIPEMASATEQDIQKMRATT